MLSMLARGLLDLLSPPLCPGCELAWSPPTAHEAFCPACSPLIELPPGGLRPPAEFAAAVAYQGPVADAIRRFKYARVSQLAPQLSSLLMHPAQAYAGRVDAVVPMPLHPSRLRERGFNPSALLARPIARALGVPLQVAWLKRRRATPSQAGLSSEARQQNVRGAFLAGRATACRILLIDDVCTTGATLRAAGSALQAHGHDVVTLALAWAPSNDPALSSAAERDDRRPGSMAESDGRGPNSVSSNALARVLSSAAERGAV
jgi:ComF family protein